MSTTQQTETLRYFSAQAGDWHAKAEGEHRKVNIIAQRNSAVLATVNGLTPRPTRLLDIGCGTGQLVIDAAALGMNAVGVDFAPEMIEICERNRSSKGVETATFICASVFDFAPPGEPYDVISALGFIEYITPEQMHQFFRAAAKWLRPGGALVVGSRNRLFNALSLNAFTAMERELGTLDDLLQEAQAIAQAESQADALHAAATLARDYPQPTRHPTTTVEVSIRYQYSPGDLTRRLKTAGFTSHLLYPIHYHGLMPAAARHYPEVHREMANIAHNLGSKDFRLAPFSSSFVLDARRS